MSDHFFSAEENERKQDRQPWYNNGDKVAGLATTMIVLTVVIIFCLGLIALAIKLFF